MRAAAATPAAAWRALVEADPTATAVRDAGGDWTRAELDALALRVAAAIAAQTRPDERVGLWFGHGATQVAGLLGALLAGRAYVPLDPGGPPARRRWQLADAAIRLVVTDRASMPAAEALSAGGFRLVVLEELEPVTELAHVGNWVKEHGRFAKGSAETCAAKPGASGVAPGRRISTTGTDCPTRWSIARPSTTGKLPA